MSIVDKELKRRASPFGIYADIDDIKRLVVLARELEQHCEHLHRAIESGRDTACLAAMDNYEKWKQERTK